MFTSDQLDQVSALVNEATSILLIFPSQASFDTMAATGSLAQSFSALGDKDVQVVTPTERGVQTELFGEQQVRSELGNKTLQVSFPYTPEKVDKVSYNIDDENNRFYLTVQPQKGEKPLDYHDLEYAYVGAEADLIILVGVSSYDSLENLYFGYEDMFKDTTVISLNTYETSMGNIKLNASGMTSLSEAVTMLARVLNLPLSGEVATNLLSGIEQTTQNFSSYSATADTFESVAYLMRQGARRVKQPAPRAVSQTLPYPETSQSNAPEPSVPNSSKTDGVKLNGEKKKRESRTIKLNKDKVKQVGSLQYQPGETSMGTRG